MDKLNLGKEFAMRLRDSMIQSGFYSLRSNSGVDIDKLAELSGHSLQICRKYLRGQAIPEPVKLAEIASKLNVSPGWLLFGDLYPQNNKMNTHILIDKNLLHYMFTQARTLYHTKRTDDELSDFLVDLTKEVSLIDANEEQSKQIIDLVLSSAKHFSAR